MVPQATLLGKQLILKLGAYFKSGTKNLFSEFVEWLNELDPPLVHASAQTLPRPFLLQVCSTYKNRGGGHPRLVFLMDLGVLA